MHLRLMAALKAQAEARQAYNALGADADEAELRVKLEAVQAADQAVVEAFEQGAAAPAELRDRVSLGRYLMAFAGQSQADGAERELRAELGLSDQALPLEVLLPTPEERAGLEARADAVSPQNVGGTAALSFGSVFQTTGPLLSRVFTQTDTAFLGVSMPMVPAGERIYPVMAGGTDAGMVARGSAGADAGSAKFDVVSATPHRLTGRYVFDLEGVAALGGMLESTLRSDLRMVLGFQMDSQVLNGDGTGANVSGIVKSLPLVLPPGAVFDGTAKGDPSAQADWHSFRRMGYRGLDGKYARMESDIRILLGQESYQRAREVFLTGAADAKDAVMALRELGVAVRQSFLIADPAVADIDGNNDGKGGTASTKEVQSAIAAAEPGAAVAPVWQGITMIRDPYTEANKAQIVITAHMLFDFVLRRSDGWKRYAVRTEA